MTPPTEAERTYPHTRDGCPACALVDYYRGYTTLEEVIAEGGAPSQAWINEHRAAIDAQQLEWDLQAIGSNWPRREWLRTTIEHHDEEIRRFGFERIVADLLDRNIFTGLEAEWCRREWQRQQAHESRFDSIEGVRPPAAR